MGRRTGVRAAYRLAQNNNQGEYTAPEVAFEELFKGKVIKPPAVHVFGINGEEGYDFKPDFQFIGSNLLVEIDGPYHRTKRQEIKTHWRDSQLLAKGYRILHIDTELLTVKKYNQYVSNMSKNFLKSSRLLEHLYA